MSGKDLARLCYELYYEAFNWAGGQTSVGLQQPGETPRPCRSGLSSSGFQFKMIELVLVKEGETSGGGMQGIVYPPGQRLGCFLQSSRQVRGV